MSIVSDSVMVNGGRACFLLKPCGHRNALPTNIIKLVLGFWGGAGRPLGDRRVLFNGSCTTPL